MPYGDRDLKKSKALGGGSANEVHKVQYKGNIGASGTDQGFFKPDQAKGFVGPSGDPEHMSDRAVASYRLAKAIGLDHVVAEEDFATHGGQKGSVSAAVRGTALQSNVLAKKEETKARYDSNVESGRGNRFGMKKRSKFQQLLGKGKYSYHEVDRAHQRDPGFDNPATQRGLLDLQALDAVTGQRDRHGGNVFIDEAGGVKGIDNDLAFRDGSGYYEYAKEGKRSAQDVRAQMDVPEQQYQGLPPMMHTDTAAAISGFNFKKKNLRQVLAKEDGSSMLGDTELAFVKARGRAMQSHVQDLRKQGKVTDRFDAGTYGELKAGRHAGGETNNYIARSEDLLDEQRTKGFTTNVPKRTAPPARAVPARPATPAPSPATTPGPRDLSGLRALREGGRRPAVPAPRAQGTPSPAVARAQRAGFSYA